MPYLFPGLGVALAAVATGLDFPVFQDEKYYYPMAVKFSRGITRELLRTYDGIPCSIGPVMHAIYGAWIHLTGLGFRSARLLSVLFAAGAGATLVDLGRLAGVRRHFYFGVAVLALPHFLSCGITVLSESCTLLSAALAVNFWIRGLRSGCQGWIWLSTLPLAASINTRPSQIAIPLAFLALGLLRRERRVAPLLAPLLSILPQLPLWMMWGGPFNPTQARGVLDGIEATPYLYISTIVHFTSVIGFIFWPALLTVSRRAAPPLSWAGTMLLVVVAFFAFQPDLSDRFAGPVALLGRVRGGILRPVVVAFYFAGGVLLLEAASRVISQTKPAIQQALASACLACVLIYAISPLAFERYLLMVTPFWLVLIVPRLEGCRRAWLAWRAWVIALILSASLSVAAIQIDRPVGRWATAAGQLGR